METHQKIVSNGNVNQYFALLRWSLAKFGLNTVDDGAETTLVRRGQIEAGGPGSGGSGQKHIKHSRPVP